MSTNNTMENAVMRVEVYLPELGEDAGDKASVSFWYADVDETIGEGDDLVEMVTDKATFNVPCPASGVLLEISAKEGASVKVGDLLGVLEVED